MKKNLLFIIFALLFVNVFSCTITVTNLNDSGPGSLRNAVALANNTGSSGFQTICFDSTLISNGSDTIFLNSEINISSPYFTMNGLYNSTDTLYISGQNTNRIFNISSCFSVVLNRMVLIDGYSPVYGGAILCSNEYFNLNNSVIRNCSAQNGGAIAIQGQSSFCATDYDPGSNTKILNCTIENCTATYEGGAIYCTTAAYIGMSWGPQPSHCGLKITNTNVIGNQSTSGLGGGIYYRSILYDNYPYYSATNANSYLEINYSTIANNSSFSNGAGIYTKSENIHLNKIKSSTITNNTSGVNGGGLFTDLTDTLGVNEILNSTICFNNSLNSGKGIFNLDTNTVSTIKGSILALNGTNSFNQNINNHTTTSLISHNILDGIFPNFGTNSYFGNLSSLNLGPLQNNGGNTLTILPLVGSIALNNGDTTDNSYSQNRPITDGQREIGAAEAGCFSLEDNQNIDTICQGGSFIFPDGITINNINPNAIDLNGRAYIYHANFTSISGCDSIVKETLYVNGPAFNQITVQVCFGSDYTFPDGHIVTNVVGWNSRDIMYSLPSGCDSIYRITLAPIYITGFLRDTICSGSNYVFPNGYIGQNISSFIQYRDTTSLSSGCDSVFVLNLYVTSILTTEFIPVCSGGSYTLPNGTIVTNITSSQDYYETIQLPSGCDSVHMRRLYSPISPTTVYTHDYICYGGDYIFPDGSLATNITNWQSDNDTFAIANGCDSIHVQYVHANPIIHHTETFSICNGSDYTFPNGTTITNITNPTQYHDTLTTASGCDSIYTTNINIIPYIFNDSINICYGGDFTFPDGSIAYNVTNLNQVIIYRDTFPIINACDSVYAIYLTPFQPIIYNDTIPVCFGNDIMLADSSIVLNVTQDTTITFSIETPSGCDSIIETLIQVLPKNFATVYDTICSGVDYTFLDDSIFYNITNPVSHQSIFQNVSGCDSIIEERIFIRVLSANDFTLITESLCFNSSYTLQNGVILQNLINDTIFNITNCYDSITYSLIVEDDFVQSSNVVICPFDNYYMPDGTVYNNIDSSFTHINSFISASGCDSTLTIQIVVDDDNFTTEYIGLCVGDSFTFADGFSVQNIQEGLNHYNYFTSYTGCDSIFNTVISIPQINDSILLNIGFNFVQLIAVDNYADYQWYNCTSNTLLIGDTNQIFQPTENGSYQVKLTKGNCEVYSECIPVSGLTPISNLAFENLKLYPNPVSKQLILESENLNFEFSILDITGKEISLNKEKTTGKIIFDTQKLSSGVYFLNVKNEASNKMFKFIKE